MFRYLQLHNLRHLKYLSFGKVHAWGSGAFMAGLGRYGDHLEAHLLQPAESSADRSLERPLRGGGDVTEVQLGEAQWDSFYVEGICEDRCVSSKLFGHTSKLVSMDAFEVKINQTT